jgi:maltose O-acetyltransferase
MNLRIAWEMFRDDLKRIPFDLAANRVLGSVLVPRLVRAAGYRLLGADVSIRANIYPHVTFQTNRVTIGSAVTVNEGTRFANNGRVALQDNVSVGQEVLFLSDSHEIGPTGRRNGGADIDAPIVVETGSWIGARAIIMPGVTVGAGTIVAAGAVVTRDCKPNRVYAGVPAREIRELDD